MILQKQILIEIINLIFYLSEKQEARKYTKGKEIKWTGEKIDPRYFYIYYHQNSRNNRKK